MVSRHLLINGAFFFLIASFALIIAPRTAYAEKSPGGVRYGDGNEIILQGFHWNSARASPPWYDTLKQMAPTVAADGFTAIWMPPPWRDDSYWKDDKTGASGGGEGYFWRDFDKNSHYGTDFQLQQAAQALTAARIKIIYDIVPNHRDRQYPMDALPKDGKVWRSDCAPVANGANDCDDGDPFMSGDADLNIANPLIANLFKDELIRLRDRYGAGGFRFDYVRGYAPEHVQSWMTDTLDSGFCVGELWKAPNEYPTSDPRSKASWQDVLKDWSDHSGCGIFDFALKERMQNGSISDWRQGLNGNPEIRWREVAVTFVDNHDTGYSPAPPSNGQHHWVLPDKLVKQAYTYILLSPGTPTVYWPHMYNGTQHDYLRLLIQARRQAGIRSDSEIQFSNGYGGLVAIVKGSQQQLVIALDSTLADPSQVANGVTTPAVTFDSSDGSHIRVWRSGPANAKTTIQFQCDKGITQQGDSVYVVGSASELGNWDPAKAVRLTDVSAYPTWKGSVELPTMQDVAWKCIVRNENDPTQVKLWQAGTNNELIVVTGTPAKGSF
ncbi:glucan 1,4-alpha-maltotetraohydrolase domain-containing protein [Collimonas humicola]|uniref:glucan 1,4-alpha-maltotetraohydrolase domain-containing protein n=1 Tax=Collimonas humicola TaxID=2825886 RepID=UPI001B8DA3BE|nr:glucan 1,4-alpha-maltotetraohydrolase domain-containing protein [Collimonas humicola]